MRLWVGVGWRRQRHCKRVKQYLIKCLLSTLIVNPYRIIPFLTILYFTNTQTRQSDCPTHPKVFQFQAQIALMMSSCVLGGYPEYSFGAFGKDDTQKVIWFPTKSSVINELNRQ